jgi:hypothetical protein
VPAVLSDPTTATDCEFGISMRGMGRTAGRSVAGAIFWEDLSSVGDGGVECVFFFSVRFAEVFHMKRACSM